MLKEQAIRTPAPQWVRVIGGWSEFQFAERRMPTLAEINAVSQAEKADFERWIDIANPGQGDDFYRLNGAGEMLVFSAADFEDFTEPRPDLAATMEGQLTEVIQLLAENNWPFRLHATYDESITRF